MREREFFSVEEKAAHYADRVFNVDVCNGVVAAFVVGFVADDRVVDRREMDADLVRTAGLYLDVDEGEFFETLADLPEAECLPAVRGDGHFCAVPAVAGDGAVYGAGIVARVPVDEGDVGFENLAEAKLVGEGFVGLLVLGDDDQAGRVFVEAMDDAYAVLSRRFSQALFGRENHPVRRSGVHPS